MKLNSFIPRWLAPFRSFLKLLPSSFHSPKQETDCFFLNHQKPQMQSQHLSTHLDGLGFNDGLLSRCLGDFLSWCWLSLLSSGCRFASFGFLKLLKKERESYELIVNSQSYRNSRGRFIVYSKRNKGGELQADVYVA